MIEESAARSIGKTVLLLAMAEAHRYGWNLLEGLSDGQWRVPYQPGINPPLWELAHMTWFTEWWTLRQARPFVAAGMDLRAPSKFDNADEWLDSSRIAHRDRWRLPMPPRAEVRDYCESVLDAVCAELDGSDDGDEVLYFFRLALFHADMHNEALTYMCQSLNYPVSPALASMRPDEAPTDDIAIEGGRFVAGFAQDSGFAFDNELQPHERIIAPFAMSAGCVTNRQFARFVWDGGYTAPRCWSEAGWRWRVQSRLRAPLYWRRARDSVDGDWEQCRFGVWQALPLDEAVCHVNAFEAEAYCNWAQRRLPSEFEWEYAAANGLVHWGHSVWEWTSDQFLPYPDFAAGPYRDYSLPWFGNHRSVRGGSFATHERMRHPRYRNFYLPERNDIFVGFRTCAFHG